MDPPTPPKREAIWGGDADSPTARPRRGAKRPIGDVLSPAVVLAITKPIIGGGTYMLYPRAVGTRVHATVIGYGLGGCLRSNIERSRGLRRHVDPRW